MSPRKVFCCLAVLTLCLGAAWAAQPSGATTRAPSPSAAPATDPTTEPASHDPLQQMSWSSDLDELARLTGGIVSPAAPNSLVDPCPGVHACSYPCLTMCTGYTCDNVDSGLSDCQIGTVIIHCQQGKTIHQTWCPCSNQQTCVCDTAKSYPFCE